MQGSGRRFEVSEEMPSTPGRRRDKEFWFRFSGFGFRVSGFGFRGLSFWCMVQGGGCGVCLVDEVDLVWSHALGAHLCGVQGWFSSISHNVSIK